MFLYQNPSESEEEEYVPAVLRRPKVANHTIHESFTADTRDHEDHTFCGVMFDIQCKGQEDGAVPVEFMLITCLAVRGDLGPMTVWTTPGSYKKKEHAKEKWECIYDAEHTPSRQNYQPLDLVSPIRLQPGESCGVYVHSTLPGDDALVYDNQRASVTHEDAVLKVLPGQAHLSNRPFGRHGMWGFPWRERREFVGRVSYGVNYILWNPVANVHQRFPPAFKEAAWLLLLCARKPESPLYWLHDEVLYYILNMCKYDWFSTHTRLRTTSRHERPLRKWSQASSDTWAALSTLKGLALAQLTWPLVAAKARSLILEQMEARPGMALPASAENDLQRNHVGMSPSAQADMLELPSQCPW
ncbi:unnamed protein product, partial [Symbiodinium necroappetens]